MRFRTKHLLCKLDIVINHFSILGHCISRQHTIAMGNIIIRSALFGMMYIQQAACSGAIIFIRDQGIDDVQSVEISEDWTVGHLRGAIASATEKAPGSFKMIHAGSELPGDATPLADIGIGPETIVDIEKRTMTVHINEACAPECLYFFDQNITVDASTLDAFMTDLRKEVLRMIHNSVVDNTMDVGQLSFNLRAAQQIQIAAQKDLLMQRFRCSDWDIIQRKMASQMDRNAMFGGKVYVTIRVFDDS